MPWFVAVVQRPQQPCFSGQQYKHRSVGSHPLDTANVACNACGHRLRRLRLCVQMHAAAGVALCVRLTAPALFVAVACWASLLLARLL